MLLKPKICYRKQRRKNPTILARWQQPQESHQSSLKDYDVGEKEIIIYDQLSLERHDFSATKAERIRYSQKWVLSLNAEGKQPPRQQRPDYEEAKRECQRLQDKHMAETKQLYTPIHTSKQRRQNPNQLFERRKMEVFLSATNFVFVVHHGRIPHGKTGIPGGGILQNLTMSSECGFGLQERSADNSTGSVHGIHTHSVHDVQYSLFTSTHGH